MHLSTVKVSRSRYIVLAILLSLTAVIGGLLFLRPMRLPLLQRARRIADVSTWKNWWWLDTHRVFVVEETSSQRCTAFELDTNSGTRVGFPGLNRTLSVPGSNCRWELSPDGKWMVALPWSVAPRTHWLISVESGNISARHPATYFAGWLPDSSGWIGGSTNKGSHQESLFLVQGGQTIYRPAPVAIPGVNLGLTASGDTWLGEYDPYSRADLRLREIDGKTGRVRHVQSIALPPACLPSEINLSPDGNRLVWQVRPSPLSSLAALLGRRDVNTIWLSSANGTRMKNLGALPVQYGTDYDCDLSLNWLPDSQHLEVVYRQTLYILPTG
jgi:hypothetical protein